jgi:hypothetical protein
LSTATANTNRLRHLTILLGFKSSLVFSSLLFRLLLLLPLRQLLCPHQVLLHLPLLPETSRLPPTPPLLSLPCGLSRRPVLFSSFLFFGWNPPPRSLALLLLSRILRLLELGLKPVHVEARR